MQPRSARVMPAALAATLLIAAQGTSAAVLDFGAAGSPLVDGGFFHRSGDQAENRTIAVDFLESVRPRPMDLVDVGQGGQFTPRPPTNDIAALASQKHAAADLGAVIARQGDTGGKTTALGAPGFEALDLLDLAVPRRGSGEADQVLRARLHPHGGRFPEPSTGLLAAVGAWAVARRRRRPSW